MKIKANHDIVLRKVKMEHAAEIFACMDRSREFLRQWLPWVDDTKSYKDTEKYIASVLKAKGARKELVFEVCYQDKIAGLISIKDIDLMNNKAEIGYWLSIEAVGKGIMTRSCEALIRYAFEKLELNKLWIRCALENVRSCNIPKQLGFTFEGIERHGEHLHGKYIDLKVYSLLKKEWLKIQSSE